MMQTKSTGRLLGFYLSGALGQPLNATDLPVDTTGWQKVLRFSGAHHVTPLLRWAFQKNGLMSALPIDVLEHLEAMYALNLDDNLRYEDQLAHLIQTLNNLGVRPVLLKGAAALVRGLYPTAGERFVGDIDILIPPDQLETVLNKLLAKGYKANPTNGEFLTVENFILKGEHHYPQMRHPDWPVWVELHIRPVHPPVRELLTYEEVVRDAIPINWRGTECQLPSPTHFVMHAIIHSFFVDYPVYRVLAFRQLFEFAHASRVYANEIDWTVIQQRFVGYSTAYLVWASVYLGFHAPSELGVSKWLPLRARLHSAYLEAPSIKLIAVLIRKLHHRIRNLKAAPFNWKNLLASEFYARFYQNYLRNSKVREF